MRSDLRVDDVKSVDFVHIVVPLPRRFIVRFAVSILFRRVAVRREVRRCGLTASLFFSTSLRGGNVFWTTSPDTEQIGGGGGGGAAPERIEALRWVGGVTSSLESMSTVPNGSDCRRGRGA